MSRRIAVSIGAVAVAAGVALRVWNAFAYPTNWGFDARFNWEYLELLRGSWALPAPDAAWATSHPPAYYYLAAAVDAALGRPATSEAVSAIRLVGTLAGLAAVALAVLLVRRVDPGNARRAWLAALLLLFLPAHVYLSAMLNEEVLASALISAAVVGAALQLHAPASTSPRSDSRRAAGVGLATGLAWLTKLTGATALAATCAAYAADGWRRREGRAALRRVAVSGAIACAVGGWFYARNLAGYGYLYPHALPVHEVMLTMPPGARAPLDYVRVPLATFTEPQLLHPDLLRSVWGSTYATTWFDGHRFFLPRPGAGADAWGTAILLLALLPTAACAVGLARGTRRAWAGARGPDVPLLALVAFTLAGYVLFTWRNPWFAAVKGSYLLGLAVPFAFYASEPLAEWTRGGRVRAAAVWGALGLLFAAVALAFSFGLVFRKHEVPGLPWDPLPLP